MIPPKPKLQHQSEMFRISLTDACRWDHPLVQLAGKIPWELFEDQFDALYCEDNGRPGLPLRMMAGLLLLKYTRGVSDEEMVEWWLDSPYVQYFCGEKYFQQYAPLDASSLCRFSRPHRGIGLRVDFEVDGDCGTGGGCFEGKRLEACDRGYHGAGEGGVVSDGCEVAESVARASGEEGSGGGNHASPKLCASRTE